MRIWLKCLGLSGLILLGLTVGLLANARLDAPESAYIAFISNRDGQRDIYRMRNDGSDVQRITHTPAYESELAWSPDGKTIAFTEGLQTNRFFFQIKQINVVTQTIELLTPAVSEYYGLNWSPDGKQLIFSTRYGGTSRNLYRLPIGEEIPRRLTDWQETDYYPTYSSDGQWILFASTYQPVDTDLGSNNTNLFQTRPDGSDLQQITNNRDSDSQPTWSPDGQSIIYVSYREGKSDLFLHDLRDNVHQRIVSMNTYVLDPHWSPDGKWVLFTSNEFGNIEIFRIRPDGTQRENLTQSPSDDGVPIWSPIIDKAWHPQKLSIGTALILSGLLAVIWRKNKNNSFAQ